MKRKVINPNPQEKKIQKIEEKIYEHEVKDQLDKIEEEIKNKSYSSEQKKNK
jgi:hypothetical protein